MAPTVAPPLPRKVTKTKQYNLLVSISTSQYQAGTALTTDVFGPYDTLEECIEAGKEAKAEFNGYQGSLFYTCVPTYKKISF